MHKALFIMTFSLLAANAQNPNVPTSCIGDMTCPGLGIAFCSVGVPIGGFCNVSNNGTSITSTSYNSSGQFVESDTGTCPGIVHWQDCNPAYPWYLCDPLSV